MEEKLLEELYEFEEGDISSDYFPVFIKKNSIDLDFPLIHVSGINGKSAVCSFLHNFYAENGYTSALFLTSYETSICECIRINNSKISEKEFTTLFEDHKKQFKKLGLTRKEILLAIFLLHIKEKKVDLVIIESGNGGRGDFTLLDYENNILSIITSVSLAHTDILGTTSSEIAFQVSSVIGEQSKVLLGKVDENSEDTIIDEATKLHTEIFKVDNYFQFKLVPGGFAFDYRPYKDLIYKGESSYLVNSICLAIEATKILSASFPVEEVNIKSVLLKGVEQTYFERNGLFIFERADNLEAVTNALGSIKYCFNRPKFVLFASDYKTNIAAILPLINNFIDSITLTRLSDLELRNEDDYFLYLGDYKYEDNPFTAINSFKDIDPEGSILIIGNKEFVVRMKEELNEE